MRTQIAKMNVNGMTYFIVNDSTNKYNPLAVIERTNYVNEHGFLQSRQRTIDKYADFNSAMCCIMSEINHQSMTIVPVEAFYRK